MRTYYNIYLTVGQIFQQRSGLLGATGTCQIIHTNRHILQTTCKSTEMLIGKYRRRHEYSHLFTIGSSFERSAHCHLGLAEPHITANQTVHRLGHLHIGFHILCGLQLIWGVLIEETGLEFMLQIAVVAEGEAFLATALGIELDEIAGDILDMFLSALLQSFPLASTQCREARPLATILRLVFRHLI